LKVGFKDLLFTLFSFILAYFIFSEIRKLFDVQDFIKIKNTLSEAHYFWIFVSVGLGFFAYYIRAIRWKMVLFSMGYKPPHTHLLAAVMSTYFGNAIIPRSGELLRCFLLKKSDQIPVDKCLGTLITERIVDLFFLVSTIFLALILNFNLLFDFLTKNIFFHLNLNYTLAFICLIIILILVFFIFRKKIFSLIIIKKTRALLDGFLQGIKAINEMKNKSLYLFYSLLIWILYFLMTYVACFCFDELSTLSISQGLFLLVMGSLGMLVPTPGGIGAFHGAIIVAISLLGYNEILGSSLGFIIHTAHFILGLFGGALGVIYLLSRKSNPII
jgi:glycosyltransferase 2 family protein